MAEPIQVGEYQRRMTDVLSRPSQASRMSEIAAFGETILNAGATAVANIIQAAKVQRLLCAFVLGVAGARYTIVGEQGVLVQSLLMAARLSGCSALRSGVLVGSVLGFATSGSSLNEMLRFLVYAALLSLLFILTRQPSNPKQTDNIYLPIGLSFICSFAVRLVPSLYSRDGWAALPVSLAVSGLAVATGVLCWLGLTVLLELLDNGFSIGKVITLGINRVRYLLVLCIIIIGGLEGIAAGPINISHVLASAIVLIAGLCYGPATGSLIGSIAGFGLSAAHTRYLPGMIAYPLAGMASGLLSNRSVIAALAVSAAAGSATCFAYSERFRGFPAEVGLGLTVGACFAYAVASLAPQYFSAHAGSEEAATSETEISPILAARERLKSLTDVFGMLAKALAGADQESTLRQSTEFDLMLEELHQRLCTGCGRNERCWGKRFYPTYEMFLTLFSELEVRSYEDPRRAHDEVPRYLRDRCINSRRAVTTALDILEQKREQCHVDDRASDVKNIISSQFKGLAEVVERIIDEICEGEANADSPARMRNGPRRSVEIGVYRTASSSSAVSGDSRLVHDLGTDRILVVLGDGMGAGEKAASESRFATTMVKELLAAGLSLRAAIETVNSIMLMRRMEESFSTLDIAIIDVRKRHIEFTKMGSCPSYLKRGKSVERISSSALPIGILPGLEFETVVRPITSGDLLVMVSDGVLGCTGDVDEVDQWVTRYLQSTSITSPRELVNALIDDMKSSLNAMWDDDATMIAVRVP